MGKQWKILLVELVSAQQVSPRTEYGLWIYVDV